ncbi:MAG: heme exporter protein CcmB [Ferrimicrobium sp.]
MIHTALAIVRKDLLIEWRARILINQILPFVFAVLVLFAFAFDTRVALLSTVAPGLFWVTAFFALQLAVTRSVGLESENQVQEGLIVMGVNPRGIFLGKVMSVVIEAIALEIVLGAGIAVLFNTPLHEIDVLFGVSLIADIGVAAVGVMLATVAYGTRGSDSLLPLLLFPVAAPVLLSATKAWEYGLQGKLTDLIPWLELIVAFSLIYLIIGMIFYGTVLEE